MYDRKLSSFYSFFLRKNGQPGNEFELQNELLNLGIKLDIETGHLFYNDQFKSLPVSFNLVFVRHGETYGNCGQVTAMGKIDDALVKAGIKDKEKRIYQGDVDTEINQLTEYGKQQAMEVARKLKNDFLENNWKPDVIFVSPLSRAKETALPFVRENKFEDRFFVHEGIKEISFGAWDNRRVCDIPSDDSCHFFYRHQNALVKSSGVNSNSLQNTSENFCEVLLRSYQVMMDLNENYPGKKILMFSHSMFGAACCILLGKGNKIENDAYLAFDGKRKDDTYYTMPNATPFSLNFDTPRIQKTLLCDW